MVSTKNKINMSTNTIENLIEVVENTTSKIAPLWSLENYVAVNPYFGMSHLKFNETANYLQAISNIKMTMPISFYLNAYKKEEIYDQDIKRALVNTTYSSISDFIKEAKKVPNNEKNGFLIQDLVSKNTKLDWSSIIIDRITSWASNYFDKNHAVWKTTSSNTNLFDAWLFDTKYDRSLSILGLKNMGKTLDKFKNISTDEIIHHIVSELGLEFSDLEIYLHSLFLRVNGWSSYIAGIDWDDSIYSSSKKHLKEFGAILLTFEYLLFSEFKEKIEVTWETIKPTIKKIKSFKNEKLEIELIFQQAYDNASQRKVVQKINEKSTTISTDIKTPKFQAVFCIDVRSEVYRRNLEMQSDEIETLGFAGFFGVAIKYKPIGFEENQNQCPVLLPSGRIVEETVLDAKKQNQIIYNRQKRNQLEKHWKSFKSGAVSCFSFVSPIGLTYLPKLLSDSFHWTRPVQHPNDKQINKKDRNYKTVNLSTTNKNGFEIGIPMEEQVNSAKAALTNMSLKNNFGKLILIVGHGSSTVNNPHATGLDCGACGGHTGESNARILSKILNNPLVRKELEKSGIVIPTESHFIAALHDTTTDEISLLDAFEVPEKLKSELEELQIHLSKASELARMERSYRIDENLQGDKNKFILQRSKDWSQTRPELGLAGCNTFIIAPRKRSQNCNFEGKSFLHNYNWETDTDFKTLELIMTAPMVVTSWINLQYYASSVDNKHAGAGNKVLHNIVGGYGVIEGFGGDLKVGLALQSVHDGTKFQHLPQRLNVVIDAPLKAINEIIEKHESIKNLVDNKWINLLAFDEKHKVKYVYNENLEWEIV
jgi:uncharacterized protein YbcC (UPF0753/DUF2309 family)